MAVYMITPNFMAETLSDALLHSGYANTKLSSIGAYLNSGQTTILTIVKEDEINKIRDIAVSVKDKYTKSDKKTIAVSKGLLKEPSEDDKVHVILFTTEVNNFIKI